MFDNEVQSNVMWPQRNNHNPIEEESPTEYNVNWPGEQEPPSIFQPTNKYLEWDRCVGELPLNEPMRKYFPDQKELERHQTRVHFVKRKLNHTENGWDFKTITEDGWLYVMKVPLTEAQKQANRNEYTKLYNLASLLSEDDSNEGVYALYFRDGIPYWRGWRRIAQQISDDTEWSKTEYRIRLRKLDEKTVLVQRVIRDN